MRLRAALVVVIAGSAGVWACGTGGGPAAPTPIGASSQFPRSLVLPAGPVAASGSAADVALRGLVRDSVTGRPVAGARVELGEDREAVSDGSGIFSIPGSEIGVVALRAEAEGYFPHETHARSGGTSAVEIELIPQGGKFDLNFYDNVFRNLGETGTYTWATEPRFEILDKVFDCVDHQTTDACDLFEATDEEAPGHFVSMAREVVHGDASRLTGGAVLGADLRVVDVAPGTRITRSEAWVRDTVRIVIARMPDTRSWTTRWIYRGTWSYYSGFIIINKQTNKSERGVYSHELAHSLGYSHPLGGDRVPIPSIMRYGDATEPTPADILHGAILYRRPAGSRTPDVDPGDFVANGSRAYPVGAGDLIVETVR